MSTGLIYERAQENFWTCLVYQRTINNNGFYLPIYPHPFKLKKPWTDVLVTRFVGVTCLPSLIVYELQFKKLVFTFSNTDGCLARSRGVESHDCARWTGMSVSAADFSHATRSLYIRARCFDANSGLSPTPMWVTFVGFKYQKDAHWLAWVWSSPDVDWGWGGEERGKLICWNKKYIVVYVVSL